LRSNDTTLSQNDHFSLVSTPQKGGSSGTQNTKFCELRIYDLLAPRKEKTAHKFANRNLQLANLGHPNENGFARAVFFYVTGGECPPGPPSVFARNVFWRPLVLSVLANRNGRKLILLLHEANDFGSAPSNDMTFKMPLRLSDGF
jgi:hypothetical protein